MGKMIVREHLAQAMYGFVVADEVGEGHKKAASFELRAASPETQGIQWRM